MLFALSAEAQLLPVDPQHRHAGCGSQAAARIDRGETIRRTAARYPETASAKTNGRGEKRERIAADEIELEFWVQSFADNSARRIRATLVYEGPLVRIWVDNADTATITRGMIDQMARALDTATPAGSRDPNKGIVRNNQEVFGMPPTAFQVDDATDFLVTDIITGAVNFVGFFSPADQLPTTQYPYSNAMNLLYIDAESVRGDLGALLGIVAHEHQHLIHYGRNSGSRSFYNEGCSELASIINGYRFRGNYGFMANTNVDLLRWTRVDDPGLVNADYERAMTFHLYLYEQFGERFIYELVGADHVGLARINIALERSGHALSFTNWTNVVRDFAVANWLRRHPIPAYGYRYSPAPDSPPAAEQTFQGPLSGESGVVTLQRAASVYHQFDNPGVLRVTATGTRDFRMMATIYRGSEVDVLDLAGSPANILGRWGGRADKIVIAWVNLSEDANDISWQAESITVGVDEKSGEENTSGPLPSSLDLR